MAVFKSIWDADILNRQCLRCPMVSEASRADGNRWIGQWDAKQCPVRAAQIGYNVSQQKPGQEQLRDLLSDLVNKNGECAIYERLLEVGLADTREAFNSPSVLQSSAPPQTC